MQPGFWNERATGKDHSCASARSTPSSSLCTRVGASVASGDRGEAGLGGRQCLEPCGRSVHDGLLKVNRDLNVPVGSSPNVDYGTTGSYARIVETLSPKSEPLNCNLHVAQSDTRTIRSPRWPKVIAEMTISLCVRLLSTRVFQLFGRTKGTRPVLYIQDCHQVGTSHLLFVAPQ